MGVKPGPRRKRHGFGVPRSASAYRTASPNVRPNRYSRVPLKRRVDDRPRMNTLGGVTTREPSDLIAVAAEVLNPHRVGDRLFGDVGAALRTPPGDVFTGVSIDTGSGTGFCAEHAAIAAMVTAGQYRIAEIVAVWRDDVDRRYVVPPCGRCREFMRQIDEQNLDAKVILGPDEAKSLRELLPRHEWPNPLPD